MITEIRRKMEMTQGQIAERLGVSRITVNRWENLVQMPSKKNLKKIVDLEEEHDMSEYYPVIKYINEQTILRGGINLKIREPSFKETLFKWVEKLINNVINWKMNRR